MLKETIALYNKVRDARASLEKQASALKDKEEELKASMLAELNAVGVDSISEGGYTIFKKHNVRAEITDHASLQEAMYQLMTQAKAEGRPLQDGLLLQRTVAKTTVIDLIASRLGLNADEDLDVNAQNTIDEANKLGIRLVDKIDVSIRKK
jgi:hypothetical protein